VPRISTFYGITITMYFGDHPPPHFHAEYAGQRAKIEVGTGALLAGSLPPRALAMAREWEELRREDLLADWELASHMQPIHPVAPLP
jgi:hypothetical protein